MTSKALMVSSVAVFTRRRTDFTVQNPAALSGAAKYLDSIYGGRYRVQGTAAVAGTPDVMVERMIVLYDKLTRRPVRSQQSRPNGVYDFVNISIGPWFVLAFDHTGEYNAVVADNIFGTPM